jgi:hypothetical protein
MKREYDLSKGKRGPVAPLPLEKIRITIRLDRDIVVPRTGSKSTSR